MLTIEVLGPGCMNCRKLEQLACQAVENLGVEARIAKVTDMKAILAHGVVRTPGLAIDGKLVASGRIPTVESIAGWIRDANRTAA